MEVVVGNIAVGAVAIILSHHLCQLVGVQQDATACRKLDRVGRGEVIEGGRGNVHVDGVKGADASAGAGRER
jgi:hypothetical protein